LLLEPLKAKEWFVFFARRSLYQYVLYLTYDGAGCRADFGTQIVNLLSFFHDLSRHCSNLMQAIE